MSAFAYRDGRGLALVSCAAVMMLSPASGPRAQAPAITPSPVTPNFDLARPSRRTTRCARPCAAAGRDAR